MVKYAFIKILSPRAIGAGWFCWFYVLLVCCLLGTGQVSGQNDNTKLVKSEIKNLAPLVAKLRVHQDSVAGYLWESFSPETRELFTKEEAAETPSEALVKVLLEELNRVIQGPVWYDAGRFAGVTLAPETERLLKSDPADAYYKRLLNRWLLEDAYPQEIEPTKFILTSRAPVPTPTPAPLGLVLRPRSDGDNANGAANATASPNATPVPTPTPPLPEGLETSPFYQVLKLRNIPLPEDCYDAVGRRIVAEYGAVFVAQDVKAPPRCLFASDDETQAFQTQPDLATTVTLRGVRVTLQNQALQLFGQAYNEGLRTGVKITPRGPDAAQRSFSKTAELWRSRLLPALAHWTQRGKISAEEAARIRNLPLREQVAAVLELEAQGFYFSKDLTKSILYSVAAPGSSQHIALLALDVAEFESPRVRALLAKYGWYQTVKSDLPHFTFIGVPETQLPQLGLRLEVVNGHRFWLPDVKPAPPQ